MQPKVWQLSGRNDAGVLFADCPCLVAYIVMTIFVSLIRSYVARLVSTSPPTPPLPPACYARSRRTRSTAGSRHHHRWHIIIIRTTTSSTIGIIFPSRACFAIIHCVNDTVAVIPAACCSGATAFTGNCTNGKSSRVHHVRRVIPDIRIPIEALTEKRILDKRIRAQKTCNCRVVDSTVHVHEVKLIQHLMACETFVIRATIDAVRRAWVREITPLAPTVIG